MIKFKAKVYFNPPGRVRHSNAHAQIWRPAPEWTKAELQGLFVTYTIIFEAYFFPSL